VPAANHYDIVFFHNFSASVPLDPDR